MSQNQNQNLHSLTKLTEFARDFENQPETLLGRFVNKIQNVYNHGYNTVNEISSNNTTSNTGNPSNSRSEFYTNPSTNSMNPSNLSNFNTNKDNNNDEKSNDSPSSSTTIRRFHDETNKETDINPEYQIQEGRTMVNVLLRIRNLVTAKNTVNHDF